MKTADEIKKMRVHWNYEHGGNHPFTVIAHASGWMEALDWVLGD